MRLTSTVCTCKTSGTILSDVPAARKLRLPGLVFHVRLGMEYVTCLQGSQDPVCFRSLKNDTDATQQCKGRVSGGWGRASEGHCTSTIPVRNNHNWDKKHVKAMRMCECVSICPCMRDACIQCIRLCGHTCVEARDRPYMHSPITLQLKCWVLVSHWMTDLATLVSPLALGLPHLHCPNAGTTSGLPSLHPCKYQRSDLWGSV